MALTIKKGLVILAVSMLLLGKIFLSHTQLNDPHLFPTLSIFQVPKQPLLASKLDLTTQPVKPTNNNLHHWLKTNHPITYLTVTTTLLNNSVPIFDSITLNAMTLSNKRLKATHHTKQLALYSSILGRASKFSILAKKIASISQVFITINEGTKPCRA